jgi:hypothetical protein
MDRWLEGRKVARIKAYKKKLKTRLTDGRSTHWLLLQRALRSKISFNQIRENSQQI